MARSVQTGGPFSFLRRGSPILAFIIMPTESRSFGRREALTLLAVAFIISRLFYFFLGVRFDAVPLEFYNQYIDPLLLRNDLWTSLYYLKEQTPLYNLFFGLVLQLFPEHSTAAFAAAYLAIGLALILCLFDLLERFAVPRPLALTIALVFSCNPVTILYENLLFYEYPLTFLLCLASLALHRFATSARRLDATVFFSCLAIISGIRSIFHLVWFLLLAAMVFYTLPRWRRTTATALILPAALVFFMYGKSFVLFGNWVPGADVYASANLAIMSTRAVPPAKLQALIDSGAISPAYLRTNIYNVKNSPVMDLIPMPPKTGIAVLDDRIKSNGFVNWNSLWMAEHGKRLRKDANLVLRLYPIYYLYATRDNFGLAIEPASRNFPFDGRTGAYDNVKVLAKPLQFYVALSAGKFGDQRPWLNLILYPVLLVYGLWLVASWFIAGWKQRKLPDGPAGITIFFIVSNIYFLCAAVVFISEADHNRYRDEVSALFAVVLGLGLSAAFTRSKAGSYPSNR